MTFGKRTDLIDSWLSTIETLPLLLNRYTSQAIMLMAQKPRPDGDETCPVVSKMLVFRLGDISKVGTFNKRLLKLVEDFDAKSAQGKRDFKKPLQQPVALAINVVALNPDDIPKTAGTVIKKVEC